ncbi:MAG: NAD(+) synthase, partial [Sedimentisphaerales bacterium]|nr:NAD(+) synthase [Sedimentisphaerales bacterium]
ALVTGTRDYIRKNGFKKALIGLSGGIDSAIVAAIAAEAIGSENVVGVSMPSRFNSKATQSDARTLAKNLVIEFKEIPIEPVFKVYLDVMTPHFNGRPQDSAEENIQARIRGNILMGLSNKFGWLVLTTGNKSELAVGYCTLYGDMSGGFAVIKDVPKTIIYKLAEYINRDAEIIPSSVIDRAPSAELRDNQTDQDSLPPYDQLDDIIDRYVGEHESLEKISRKYDAATVQRVRHLIDRNEYKRRQAPPGIKITSRAFGKDWRLPITNKYRD